MDKGTTSKDVSGWTCLAAAAAALVAGALLLTAMTDARAGDRRKGTDAPALYHNYCSVCHGDAGDGNSRAKNSLIPPPANFTDAKLQGKLTREYIAAIVRHGKPKTAMVSFATQLNDREIDALADYVRATFVDHAHDAGIKRGRGLYGQLCTGCHGVNGKDLAEGSSRERVVAAIAVGRKGTPMPGYAGQLSPDDIEAVADYVQKWLMASQGNISGVSAHGGRERDATR